MYLYYRNRFQNQLEAVSFKEAMKTGIYILFATLIWGQLTAQNLVQNYSLEDTVSCPVSSGEIFKAVGWFQPNTLGSSTDYFHGCSATVSVPNNPVGNQSASTGIAYGGIICYTQLFNLREYIEATLISPLTKGKEYCVEFYVSLADGSKYATDIIGAHLSVDSVLMDSFGNIPLYPHINNTPGNIISDAANWVLIGDTYTAGGGEKFITIGNFYHYDSIMVDTVNPGGAWSLAYYYIDDVFVRLMEAPPESPAGGDTTICIGGVANLGVPAKASFEYSWQSAVGITDTTAAQQTVNPTQTTIYILTVTDTAQRAYSCRATATDTVTVTVINCDTLENNAWLPNVFSPNGDGENDVLFVRGTKVNSLQFTVYNRWGEKVFESADLSYGWDGTYKGEKLNPGVFVYYCKVVFEDGTERELKGNVTLVK